MRMNRMSRARARTALALAVAGLAAGATAVTPKPAKSDVSATRHNASPAAVAEGFRDPYQTPLLLNAKPLKGSQP